MTKIKIKFESGSLFAHRFKIIKPLGQGGNASVYLALDTLADPPFEIALKICRPAKKDKKFIAKFLREAFELSRLDHPNIVKLIDFGNDSEFYYMATEFIKGTSIREWIREAPVPEEYAIFIAVEIGKAFEHMNELGIIHRDVKPDNILVSDDNEIILVDFGLAKDEGQQTISKSGKLYGTPQFVSPEYINESDNITIKTDIYSLGITLFHAVTGKLPFHSRNTLEIVQQHLYEPLPRITEFMPELSEEFADIIEKMLLKDPEERCSLKEMREVFERLKANPT